MHAGTPPRGREVAFAACLSLVLAVGVIGVLLLNTSMQQQADRIAAQHQRISALAQRIQLLSQRLDVQSDPARLAARARQLHLRPVKRIQFVSAPSPEAGRAHAG